jgi:hypothetical protein
MAHFDPLAYRWLLQEYAEPVRHGEAVLKNKREEWIHKAREAVWARRGVMVSPSDLLFVLGAIKAERPKECPWCGEKW